jgi:uncharacterized protein YbjQ (UPF0145 family)
MIVVTCDEVPGKKIVRTLGLVRGNTVRVRNIGRDIAAAFKTVIGGEVEEYTKLLAEAREQALGRMVEEAEQLGANAIVALRFGTSEVMQHAAEIVAYGTGVVVE